MPKHRRRRILSAAVGALALAAVIAGGIGFIAALQAPKSTLVDMQGNTVEYDPGEAAVPSASATPDIGTRFTVNSVGLDVPLGSLSAVDGQVTPPGFTSAYLIDNVGVRPEASSEGTVFVVMHSLRDGAVGPGNFLIDVDDGTTTVNTGSIVTVGGVNYSVSSSQAILKPSLAATDDIWISVPGRLVIITCLQRPTGGPSESNMVIFANRVD
jgi:hypothetical protein